MVSGRRRNEEVEPSPGKTIAGPNKRLRAREKTDRKWSDLFSDRLANQHPAKIATGGRGGRVATYCMTNKYASSISHKRRPAKRLVAVGTERNAAKTSPKLTEIGPFPPRLRRRLGAAKRYPAPLPSAQDVGPTSRRERHAGGMIKPVRSNKAGRRAGRPCESWPGMAGLGPCKRAARGTQMPKQYPRTEAVANAEGGIWRFLAANGGLWLICFLPPKAPFGTNE